MEVDKMSNQELLNKFGSYQRWFGDDYSLYLPSDQDYEDAYKIEQEILKRMSK